MPAIFITSDVTSCLYTSCLTQVCTSSSQQLLGSPAGGSSSSHADHIFKFDCARAYSLLEGKSGVGLIDRFDASEFPTKFAAQIRNFDIEG